MAVEIVNFPFQGQDDKCLVLSNAQWAATGIGTSWKQLRIGIRFAVEDYPTSIPAPLRFFIGVMSNPVNNANGQLANGYLSANMGHMVGAGSLSDNWSRSSNSSRDLVSFGGNLRAIRAVGGSLLYSSQQTSSSRLYGSLASFATKRFAFIVQVLKSSVSASYGATITAWFPAMTANNGYPSPPYGTLTLQGFLGAMVAYDPVPVLRQLDPGGGGDATYSGYAFDSLSINESANGPLNAIHVAWGKLTPRLAISDICYAILE